MWPIFALGSALAFCFVSVCDKRLISYHFQGVPPLCLWCGISGMLYGSILLTILGLPAGVPLPVSLAPVGSGLLMGCSVVLLFRGLRLMEASRAVAIAQINPIFVALLAMPLLGERISPAQWGGIGLVVAGAALISGRLFQETPAASSAAGPIRSGPSRPGAPAPALSLPFLTGAGAAAWYGPALLLCSALCAAGSFVVAKAALNAGLPTLTVFAMQQTVVGATFFVAGLRGGPRLLAAVKQPRVLAMLLFGESLMPAVSILLSIYAYSLGPASLVAAALATRPLFVFVASTLLSRMRWRLLDESLTPRALLVKGVSIIMIVGGVGALSLSGG